MLKRYVVENRYQDSGWEFDRDYETAAEAYVRAAGMSHNSILYGMVRVVDSNTGNVLRTYPAGSRGYFKEHTQEERAVMSNSASSDLDSFYLIWSPTGPTPPRQKIQSREKAVYAARDMALKHPGQEFYVLQAQSLAQTETDVKFYELIAPF